MADLSWMKEWQDDSMGTRDLGPHKLIVGGKTCAVVADGRALVCLVDETCELTEWPSARATAVLALLKVVSDNAETASLASLKAFAGPYKDWKFANDEAEEPTETWEARPDWYLGLPMNSNLIAKALHNLDAREVEVWRGKTSGGPCIYIDSPGQWRVCVMALRTIDVAGSWDVPESHVVRTWEPTAAVPA